MSAMKINNIPFTVSIPLLGIGALTLLLSLIFCCYMWKLKRQGAYERGYKQVTYSPQKKILPNDTCPVCLEDFKSNEKLAICPCKHGFHQRCLSQWLHRKNTCPLCKAKVQPFLGERTGLVPFAVTTL